MASIRVVPTARAKGNSFRSSGGRRTGRSHRTRRGQADNLRHRDRIALRRRSYRTRRGRPPFQDATPPTLRSSRTCRGLPAPHPYGVGIRAFVSHVQEPIVGLGDLADELAVRLARGRGNPTRGHQAARRSGLDRTRGGNRGPSAPALPNSGSQCALGGNHNRKLPSGDLGVRCARMGHPVGFPPTQGSQALVPHAQGTTGCDRRPQHADPVRPARVGDDRLRLAPIGVLARSSRTRGGRPLLPKVMERAG